MQLHHVDKSQSKGWYVGPWNSQVPVSIGFANQGVDEKHYHAQMFEIYLVAQGWSRIVIDGKAHTLRAGDALVVEPHEVHTFAATSGDYLHFVVHAPFVPGDKVALE